MIKENGLVTFKCDLRDDGTEILNSSQRNNKLIWPSEIDYPKAQYRTSWKNMCNVTSMIMGLEYAGWNFPTGKYNQPEDNLGLFILTDERIRKAYKEGQPAMYNTWIKSLTGEVPNSQINNIYPPIELHMYLSKGTNLWIGSTATEFHTNLNFLKSLWKNMVEDNLPIVISTNFGGFGHIVTCVGVTYSEADYEKGKKIREENISDLPEIIPTSIKVDDPWGAINIQNNKYPVGGGGSGNNINIPWQFVVEHVKPLNSTRQKWGHIFKHGIATV